MSIKHKAPNKSLGSIQGRVKVSGVITDTFSVDLTRGNSNLSKVTIDSHLGTSQVPHCQSRYYKLLKENSDGIRAAAA